jgi:hypothetical protein
MFDEFIARILMFSDSIMPAYGDYLNRIQFRDKIVNDVVEGIIESWGMFSEVKIEFLRDKFSDREDVDLFMRKATSIEPSGDDSFNKYWIGKFLSNKIIEEIKDNDDVDRIRDLSVLASELSDVSKGKIIPVKVWNFGSKTEVEQRIDRKRESPKILKSGISLLDEQVVMEDGTVTVFLAPFKRYKSINLTNMGAVALAQGFSVFHVHYEGKRELWESRYDACLAGLPYDRPDKFYKKLSDRDKEKIKKVYENVEGNFYFMKATPGRSGYVEMRSEISRLEKEGINFDVIIVDYLNLMKSSRGKGDDWLEQGELAWDLVRLSQEGYIVVTAVQSKMEGSRKTEVSEKEREKKKRKKQLLKSSDLGRSIVILQAVDNVVALNQDEIEYEQGALVMSPLVVRYGKIIHREIPLELQLFKMRMSREISNMLDSLVDS